MERELLKFFRELKDEEKERFMVQVGKLQGVLRLRDAGKYSESESKSVDDCHALSRVLH